MDKPKNPIRKDLWKHRHKNEEMFTSDAQFKFKETEKCTTNTNTNITDTNAKIPTKAGSKSMIAVIGNRFMNGGYLPAEVLEKNYKGWNGTLHDINHMGTSTGFFLMQSDITYFVGYHTNVQYNKETKEVSMELNISHETAFASAWKGYISLCEQAGQIPNVSVTYYAKREWVKASELSANIPWEQEGYTKDDLVPIINSITPVCVSTVLEGRCNDKAGCGIRNDINECEVCSDNEDLELKAKIEEKKQELIKWLKENA